MGCGASQDVTSTEIENKYKRPDFLPPIIVPPEGKVPPPAFVGTGGIHPRHVRLEDKTPFPAASYKRCGVFFRASPKLEVDVLFFYPDLRHLGKGPSDLGVEGISALDQAKEIAENVKENVQEVASSMVSGFKSLIGSADKPEAKGPGWVSYNREQWHGVVVQLKEFDSSDDIRKPWSATAGTIPGVVFIETAGELGAWARLQPNCYQQRYVLPTGERTHSVGNTLLSAPQRLMRLYNEIQDEVASNAQKEQREQLRKQRRDAKDKLNHCTTEEEKAHAQQEVEGSNVKLSDVVPTDFVERITNASLNRAKKLTPNIELPSAEQLMNLLKRFIADFDDYTTAHCIPFYLYPIKALLSELEDIQIYNWFEVRATAKVQIGQHKYSHKKERWIRTKSFSDRCLSSMLTSGNDKLDDALDFAKEQLRGSLRFALNECTSDGGFEAEQFFPDFNYICKVLFETIDAHLIGLVEELPQPRLAKFDLEKLLEEDRRTMIQKRTELAAKISQKAREVSNIPEKLNRLTRVPHLVPRNFYPFVVDLVFPRFDATEDASKYVKPNAATLVIWAHGVQDEDGNQRQASGRTEYIMEEFEVPDGGCEESSVHAALNDGDSSVDSDAEEDPRAKWIPYPSANWRGFRCEINVCAGAAYNFYFMLDGVQFLDHDTFHQAGEGRFYRRVVFDIECNPFTVNPLKTLGFVY